MLSQINVRNWPLVCAVIRPPYQYATQDKPYGRSLRMDLNYWCSPAAMREGSVSFHWGKKSTIGSAVHLP